MPQGPFAAGDWVEFTHDHFIEPGHVVLAGMLGQVVDHPCSGCSCTPGVSTMVLASGSSEPCGDVDAMLRRVEAPGSEAVERSAEAWRTAFERCEQRHGFTGYVRVNGRFLTVERLWRSSNGRPTCCTSCCPSRSDARTGSARGSARRRCCAASSATRAPPRSSSWRTG